MTLLIREDTFPEAATRQYVAEMAMAVASVHALGYIHRDLKPDNVLLDWDGACGSWVIFVAWLCACGLVDGWRSIYGYGAGLIDCNCTLVRVCASRTRAASQ